MSTQRGSILIQGCAGITLKQARLYPSCVPTVMSLSAGHNSGTENQPIAAD
jgi:hypothetical protein